MPGAGRRLAGLVSIALVIVGLGAVGCARSVDSMQLARQAYIAGDLVAARQSLEQSSQETAFRDVAELELAMVDFSAGDVAAAEARLRRLRDQFDRSAKIAPVSELASLATDDTRRQFRPAGYEQVMIRTMLSLCSLAGDQVDAESYALQATEKQNDLARDAETRGVSTDRAFQPIALAPYVRGMIREATHHDYDDAANAYRLVSSVSPQFAPAQADISRASEGVHSSPGHGVLYVIAGVGLGPQLQPTVAPTTTAALNIASTILRSQEKRRDELVLPSIASVKIPTVTIPPSEIASIGVHVDGHLLGVTQTLTDVGRLAIDQWEAELPWTIARAVVRRAVKEAAVSKAADSLGLSGTADSLFHFAAASAWSGAEQADTRCWGMLPREFQVFRCELSAGNHDIVLQPWGYEPGPVGPPQRQTVEITDGANSYLLVNAPGPGLYVVGPPDSRPFDPDLAQGVGSFNP